MTVTALKGFASTVLTMSALSAATVYGRSLPMDPDCRGPLLDRMKELVCSSITSSKWERPRALYHRDIVSVLVSKKFADSHKSEQRPLGSRDDSPLVFHSGSEGTKYCGSVRTMRGLDARTAIITGSYIRCPKDLELGIPEAIITNPKGKDPCGDLNNFGRLYVRGSN